MMVSPFEVRDTVTRAFQVLGGSPENISFSP